MENRKIYDRKKVLYSLLVLAGGKSSRMGRDKAKLLLGEKSFLECILDKAEMLGIGETYLSGHGWEEKTSGQFLTDTGKGDRWAECTPVFLLWIRLMPLCFR